MTTKIFTKNIVIKNSKGIKLITQNLNLDLDLEETIFDKSYSYNDVKNENIAIFKKLFLK